MPTRGGNLEEVEPLVVSAAPRPGCTGGRTGEGSPLGQRLPAGVRAERSPGGSVQAPLPAVAMVTAAARWGQRGQGGTGGPGGHPPGPGRCECGPERDGGLGNVGDIGGTRCWCAQGHSALSGTEFTAGTDIKYLIIDKSARQPAVVFSRRFRWFLIC